MELIVNSIYAATPITPIILKAYRESDPTLCIMQEYVVTLERLTYCEQFS